MRKHITGSHTEKREGESKSGNGRSTPKRNGGEGTKGREGKEGRKEKKWRLWNGNNRSTAWERVTLRKGEE